VSLASLFRHFNGLGADPGNPFSKNIEFGLHAELVGFFWYSAQENLAFLMFENAGAPEVTSWRL